MLRAQLTVEPGRSRRPEDFIAVGLLVNEGEAPVEIRPELMESPSLALEILDERGEPVPLPPPPVPGATTESVRLASGSDYQARLSAFLPAWTAPGIYRARLSYRSDGEPVVSDWAEFELTAA